MSLEREDVELLPCSDVLLANEILVEVLVVIDAVVCRNLDLSVRTWNEVHVLTWRQSHLELLDEAGNVLSDQEYVYKEDERSYYALNVAVTADNYQDFTDSTKTFEPVSKQLDESKSPSKKVWLNIYNASDNFLSSTYQPLLEKYDDLLNLDVEYIGGDGQTESNITNRLGNPGQYDAFAINMVKTDNAASYTALLQ